MRKQLWLLIVTAIPLLSVSQTNVLDSLQKVVASGKKDEPTLRACLNLGIEYLRNNFDKAIAISHHGKSLAVETGKLKFESGFYSILIAAHQNTGRLDSAEYFLNSLKQLSERAKQEGPNDILVNYYSSAGLFHKKMGNHHAANPFLIKAAELAEASHNIESAAGQYMNVGNNYKYTGNYKNAQQYHLKALRLFQSINHKRGISFCLQNIALNFYELKQYQKALDYTLQSLQLKKELSDKRGMVTTLGSLGGIYLGLNNYEKSRYYSEQAVVLAREMKLDADEARFLANIGRAHNAEDKPDDALKYFEKAKLVASTSGDSSVKLSVNTELALLRKKQQEQKQLENHLVTTVNAQRQLGNKKEELSLYKNLSNFYKESKQYDKALNQLEKYHATKDSIMDEEIQMELHKLEEQYQSEKKENEIVLLKKDQLINKAQISRQRQQQYTLIAILFLMLCIAALLINRYRFINRTKRLVEIEKMRNHIARDLHDEIGSTLSSIQILSKVLLKNANEKEQYEGIKKIGDHSSVIMESMGDIVWAVNPHNDSIEQVMIKMKEFASEILDPLNIQYKFVEKGNVSAIKLDPGKRKDLYLIFKESINNAAKYSNCQNIEIVLENEGHQLRLHIKDDGKGFTKEHIKKGNGISNIEQRAGSMAGRLQYQAAEGVGTSIELSVPIT